MTMSVVTNELGYGPTDQGLGYNQDMNYVKGLQNMGGGFPQDLGYGDTQDLGYENTEDLGYGNTEDLGYGNTQDLGYGDTQDLGYGETEDLGYGNTEDLGYGNTEDLGYGNTEDLGYGNTEDLGYGKTEDLGYGKTEDLGYGKTEDLGYGNTTSESLGYGSSEDMGQSGHSNATGEGRRRPRRRCSVTKYSLEASAQAQQNYEGDEEIQKEYAQEMNNHQTNDVVVQTDERNDEVAEDIVNRSRAFSLEGADFASEPLHAKSEEFEAPVLERSVSASGNEEVAAPRASRRAGKKRGFFRGRLRRTKSHDR